MTEVNPVEQSWAQESFGRFGADIRDLVHYYPHENGFYMHDFNYITVQGDIKGPAEIAMETQNEVTQRLTQTLVNREMSR